MNEHIIVNVDLTAPEVATLMVPPEDRNAAAVSAYDDASTKLLLALARAFEADAKEPTCPQSTNP